MVNIHSFIIREAEGLYVCCPESALNTVPRSLFCTLNLRSTGVRICTLTGSPVTPRCSEKCSGEEELGHSLCSPFLRCVGMYLIFSLQAGCKTVFLCIFNLHFFHHKWAGTFFFFFFKFLQAIFFFSGNQPASHWISLLCLKHTKVDRIAFALTISFPWNPSPSSCPGLPITFRF